MIKQMILDFDAKFRVTLQPCMPSGWYAFPVAPPHPLHEWRTLPSPSPSPANNTSCPPPKAVHPGAYCYPSPLQAVKREWHTLPPTPAGSTTGHAALSPLFSHAGSTYCPPAFVSNTTWPSPSPPLPSMLYAEARTIKYHKLIHFCEYVMRLGSSKHINCQFFEFNHTHSKALYAATSRRRKTFQKEMVRASEALIVKSHFLSVNYLVSRFVTAPPALDMTADKAATHCHNCWSLGRRQEGLADEQDCLHAGF